jgi:predicted small lipoprotein YifL
MKGPTPEAGCARLPLKGAPPAARQSRFRGGSREVTSSMVLVVLVALLAGCGSKPRQPDWLVNADGAQDRYQRAYLAGRDNVAQSEFNRLRTELSSTGQPGLLARAELTRCAVQVASLQFEPCAGFEPLRADAPPAERAYADFLAGRLPLAQPQLLPEAYRAIAAGTATGSAAIEAIKDPFSRVIASAVLLRTERADPGVLQLAADTASQQGWRRAVIAWLGAQAMRAERAGAVEEAARLRRRMAIAAGER